MTAPFIHWVGGKRRLLDDIGMLLPPRGGTYWEPFLGGGAVFFAHGHRFDKAVLSDTSGRLMAAYRGVQEDPFGFASAFAEHARLYRNREGKTHVRTGETYFEYLKNMDDSGNRVLDGARFVFLINNAYQAKYEEGKDGHMSIYDSYKDSAVYKHHLMKCSQALGSADLLCGDFEQIVDPKEGDVVYCDPPYDGMYRKKYGSSNFGVVDQERLRDCALGWADKGAHVLCSNADTPYMRDLWGDFHIVPVSVLGKVTDNMYKKGAKAKLRQEMLASSVRPRTLFS